MGLFVPFGDWLPDLPSGKNPGALTVSNVLPAESSYRSFPTNTVFSSNNLTQRCQGAIVAEASNGNVYNFAGDSSALYQLTGTTFVSVTRAGNYSLVATQVWEFVQFGERVIAVNGHNNVVGSATDHQIQQLSLGAAAFTNLSAATAIAARTIAAVRDFVVIGNVVQYNSASGVYAQRIRWCGINNPDAWSADAATLSDYQDLVGDGGPVQKIIGGEYGVIFQRRAIYRMTFIGSPLVFQFDNVQRNIGLVAQGAAVGFQNLAFFLSDDGFYSFDGSVVNPIGRGRIDKTFYAEVDMTKLSRITCAVHPSEKVVIWAYPTSADGTGALVAALAFNWVYNKWSKLTINSERITRHISAGGALTLASYNTSNGLDKFDGSAASATIDTGEFQLYDGSRAIITEVRPWVEGNSASAQVTMITRNVLTESVSVGTAISPNDTGFCPVRTSARYMRIRLTTGTLVPYTHLQGVEIESAQEGKR